MGNKGRKMSNTLHSGVKWFTHLEPTAIVAKYLNLDNLVRSKIKNFINIDNVRIWIFHNFYSILRILTVFYDQWVLGSRLRSLKLPPSLKFRRDRQGCVLRVSRSGLRVDRWQRAETARQSPATSCQKPEARSHEPEASNKYILSPSNTFVLEKINASYEFCNARLSPSLWKEWRKIRRMPYCAMPLFRISFRHA